MPVLKICIDTIEIPPGSIQISIGGHTGAPPVLPAIRNYLSVPFRKNIGLSISPIPDRFSKSCKHDIICAALSLRANLLFHQAAGRQRH